MVIRQFKRLSALRKEQIGALETECKEADGTVCPVFAEPFLNYTKKVPAFFFATSGNRAIGVLSMFLPGDGTAEISALVTPSKRRQGVFTALLKAARTTIKALKIKKVLIVSCPGVKDCDKCLKKLSAIHSNSEYKMFLKAAGAAKEAGKVKKTAEASLLPATVKDVEALSTLLGDFFDTDPESAGAWLSTVMESEKTFFYKLVKDNRIIGCGGFVESFKSASVFGIGIKKEFRRQGLGRFLMTELLRQIPSGYSVVLQVSDKNAAAMSLYQKLGFAVTATTRYHTLKI